ncbi:zinc finger protein 271-like [Cryptotermes secundus]|uniref:zinc finger protein 271-like n=1 Tax=Cryptotermes secundus TaxID=105785 RepID=UPI001454C526|nr:zinc finger protein 271-like [Cryptotermes secundus]
MMSLMDIERVRGLCSEICPSSSHDAYPPIGIKAEVISDEEEEEYSVLITIPRIEVKPENPADFGNVRGLHSETCPASSHDACSAVSIKAEVLSHAEVEEDPVPLTFVGIKAEPEIIPDELQPVHGEEWPYSCDVGNKSCRQMYNLRTHQPICGVERPISCDVCNKSFSEQSTLKKQQCIQSGERPFCCGLCNKSFSWQSHLRAHQRIHSGERPFYCDNGTCNKNDGF